MIPTIRETQKIKNILSAFRTQLMEELAPELLENPRLAEEVQRQVDAFFTDWEAEQAKAPRPPDAGLSELLGLDGTNEIGDVPVPAVTDTFDETVAAERIQAVGDLYYIYQHEKAGLFRVVLKLQELFRAGTVRLSDGPGALMLYRFDRKQVLRYTMKDRMQAYRRVFGYTSVAPPPGAKPNLGFHDMFTSFNRNVAQFYRDKRISQVVRQRGEDPSFGSIAVVRRSGLDLRNNLKGASYGHIVILRTEVLQLLDEAFRLLAQEDIKRLFGSDNAWDVIETVLQRYMNEPNANLSQRNRMAIAGRDILNWLSQSYVLTSGRTQFEALLEEIANDAEEWLTSAEALGVVEPSRQPAHAVSSGNGHSVRATSSKEWWESAPY